MRARSARTTGHRFVRGFLRFPCVLLVGHCVEVTLEVVEARGPQPAHGREPLVDRAQGFRAYAVEAPLPVDARVDEACIAEHSKVLRYRGLADRECGNEITDG